MSERCSAQMDAKDMVEEFKDEIIEQLIDNGEASDDLFNDYSNGDAYHHESHVDKCYSLSDAAAILEELRDYEETDSGLWEGLSPREAISAQAAYTYGNAVYSLWRDLIGEINENYGENLDAANEEIDEQIGNWGMKECTYYLADNPDFDYEVDDLDDAKEAIKEHRKEKQVKLVAEKCIEEATK